MERLQKVIANSGLCSRRTAEQYIQEGRVKVDGVVVTTLGTQIDPERGIITVDGKKLPTYLPVVYLLNKPKGIVCSRTPQGKEEVVTSLVPDFPPVYPIGRLDKESEGAILLTNDGFLTHKLTHPSFQHSKVYRVTVQAEKTIDLPAVEHHLLKGVKLGDGKAMADKINSSAIDSQTATLYITVHEGRNHLIRRMCATLDLNVKRLVRIQIGFITLGSLKPGEYRRLTRQEIQRLHAS